MRLIDADGKGNKVGYAEGEHDKEIYNKALEDLQKKIEKYLMPLLPEEPEEITATALKREYINGFLAGQKKAYDECDDVVRELSQIKSGCSKWLEKHDAKVRADAIDDFAKVLLTNEVIDKSVVKRCVIQLKRDENNEDGVEIIEGRWKE